MDPIKIDVSIIARDLKLAPNNVEAALALLDAGNTIPFVTRFRKDQTGGLNENQLLAVKQKAASLRSLAERKATILRAIEAQKGLNDEIRTQIEKTTSSRRLEDLYLPFKSKKQSKAALARQQGLLPLATEILEAKTSDADLATRATEFVRVDKGLNSVDEVIKGVGDLISEKLAENETLRASLRKLFRDTAKLSSRLIAVDPPKTEAPTDAAASDEVPKTEPPKTEPPKTEPPKDESVKADSTEANSPSTPADTAPTGTKPAETTAAPVAEGAAASESVATPPETAPSTEADQPETAETPAAAANAAATPDPTASAAAAQTPAAAPPTAQADPKTPTDPATAEPAAAGDWRSKDDSSIACCRWFRHDCGRPSNACQKEEKEEEKKEEASRPVPGLSRV